MKINSNLNALNANNRLGVNVIGTKKASEKLSSGFRINRAGDDAAGLAVSEKLRLLKREKSMCRDNVQKGIAAANTADGGLEEIHAILQRTRELSVMASNGTYCEDDRAKIQLEIYKLMDEIERITKYTKYNGIPLLRSEALPDGPELLGSNYDEDIIEVHYNDFIGWGPIPVLPEGQRWFSDATPARPATATLRFDNSINTNDVNSLEGKSINISGRTFMFTQHFDRVLPSGVNPIIFNSTDTFEQALNRISSFNFLPNHNINNVTVSGRYVTFHSPLANNTERVYTGSGFNIPVIFNTPNANGKVFNNSTPILSTVGQGLKPVSGDYPVTGTFTYTNPATAMLNFNFKNIYDATDIAALTAVDMNNPSLRHGIQINGGSPTIPLITFTTGAGSNTSIHVFDGMTRADMETEITRVLTAQGLNPSAWTGNTLTIERSGFSSTTFESMSVQEVVVQTGTAPQPITVWSVQSNNSVATTPLSIISSPAHENSNERGPVLTITLLPGDLRAMASTAPLSFNISGTNFVIYNTEANYSGANGNPRNTATNVQGPTLPSNHIDITNATTDAEIRDLIFDSINNQISNPGLNEISRNGDTITVTYYTANSTPHPHSVGSGTVVDVLHNVMASSSGGTQDVPQYSPSILSPSLTNFSRAGSTPLTIPLDGNNDPDITRLLGSGFVFNNINFEFSNGTGTHSSARQINISGLTTLEQIANAIDVAVKQAFPTPSPSTAFATSRTDSNIIDIGRVGASTFTNGVPFLDGIFGTMATPEKTLNRGTVVGQPFTTIDFSSIETKEDIESLLGTGFRITCATCPDEFINIFFRWDNSDNPVPTHFNMAGETIYNYVVELKYVTEPSQIVQSIVDQLKEQLYHFSGVRVDENNPTILIVEDRRAGNFFEGGTQLRGSVLPGLHTNFIYELDIERIFEELTGPQIGFSNLPIYVGSFPFHQHINLRIPNLSTHNLMLDPPEPSVKTPEEANELIGRVDAAVRAISLVRAQFGADTNRLEKAFNNLTTMEENVTNSLSRIRDTDMASELVRHTKFNILQQTAQAMLAQANQAPQGILQLLA
jgi:flagellin-like hook-associated protein FlgL